MNSYVNLQHLARVLDTMRNVPDRSCRENQNAYFTFNNFFTKILTFMR